MLQKRPFTPVERGLPLTNRAQEDKQRLLAIERNREYNALLEKVKHIIFYILAPL